MLQSSGNTLDGKRWEVFRNEYKCHKVSVAITKAQKSIEDGVEVLFKGAVGFETAYDANLGHIAIARALDKLDTYLLDEEAGNSFVNYLNKIEIPSALSVLHEVRERLGQIEWPGITTIELKAFIDAFMVDEGLARTEGVYT